MIKKIKIIADKDIPYLKGVLEPFASIHYMSGAAISREDVKDADALIIRTRTKCNSELLQGSKVKCIATATIGADHIDAEFCRANHIKWENAPGCNAGSVMQYIASALLNLEKDSQSNLQDMTLGIVGHGNVGSKVNHLASLLGMKVLVNDPPLQRTGVAGEFHSLQTLMEESDIISFHVPLNRSGIDKTYHLADEKFFSNLSKKPYIINSSRGEVVKTQALKNAITSGRIKGAVIDVWEDEPFIDTELLQIVDYATPHIAGYSADGKANGTAMSVRTISAFFDLDLGDWYPSNIPLPLNKDLIINKQKTPDEDVLRELILSSYNIRVDDNKLRADTNSFEEQRARYPLRREFPAYTVSIPQLDHKLAQKISALGFRIDI